MKIFTSCLFAACALVLALGCTSSTSSSNGSTSDGGGGSGGQGFDCAALRDKQAGANCPKFDPAKYLTDCEATKSSVSANCTSKLDALGSCLLGSSVTVSCTDAGTVDSNDPEACKTQESDLQTCK